MISKLLLPSYWIKSKTYKSFVRPQTLLNLLQIWHSWTKRHKSFCQIRGNRKWAHISANLCSIYMKLAVRAYSHAVACDTKGNFSESHVVQKHDSVTFDGESQLLVKVSTWYIALLLVECSLYTTWNPSWLWLNVDLVPLFSGLLEQTVRNPTEECFDQLCCLSLNEMSHETE